MPNDMRPTCLAPFFLSSQMSKVLSLQASKLDTRANQLAQLDAVGRAADRDVGCQSLLGSAHCALPPRCSGSLGGTLFYDEVLKAVPI